MQLQGVIAHEFSHILNGDMRLNMQLMGWVFGLFVVALIGRMILQLRAAATGAAQRRSSLVGLAVMVLGYVGLFFGRLLQAAVSRQRERLADASGVQFTRNPQGLKDALIKIAGTAGRLAPRRAAMPSRRRTCFLPRGCRACSRRIRRCSSASGSSIRISTRATFRDRG